MHTPPVGRYRAPSGPVASGVGTRCFQRSSIALREDPRLALLLAHVFFNRGPYPYDMPRQRFRGQPRLRNRLAPKVGMPVDADIMTLDGYLRGGELDDIEDFPGHLVMLQRCVAGPKRCLDSWRRGYGPVWSGLGVGCWTTLLCWDAQATGPEPVDLTKRQPLL